jgi:DNA-binding transcriptional LysR family regulator
MAFELRALRAFLAVVDEGTFTDAALTLGVTQATVSRSVAALEADLGVRLLHRGRREASLTDAGRRIVGPVRRTLSDADSIPAALAESGSGEIAIGYSWAALGAHTTAVQRRWRALHPQRPLVFVQSDSATAGLADGSVELAVLRRVPGDRHIHRELIAEEPRYAAVPTADELADRDSVTLADLVDRTVAIDPVVGTTTLNQWAGFERRPRSRHSHNVDEWLTLIGGGLAVGITPESTTQLFDRHGVIYRPMADAAPVQVWLAWHADREPETAVELLALIRGVYADAG